MTPLFPALNAATAAAAPWLSGLLGLTATVETDALVAFRDGSAVFSYRVVEGCTGATSMMIYASAVLAYPATRRARKIGLVVGLPALLGANLVRLVILGWVGLYERGHFDVIHTYWWGASWIVLAGGAWIAWASLVANHAGTDRSRRADRLSRVRGAIVPVGVACASIAVFAAAGLIADGVAVWGRLLHGPFVSISSWFGITLAPNVADPFAAYGFRYAALAGIVTLFLVSPGMPWRQRAKAAALIGVPVAYLIQLTSFGVRLGIAIDLHSAGPMMSGAEGWDGFVGTFLASLEAALYLGIPALVWYRWTTRRRPVSLDRSRAPRAHRRAALRARKT